LILNYLKKDLTQAMHRKTITDSYQRTQQIPIHRTHTQKLHYQSSLWVNSIQVLSSGGILQSHKYKASK